jgi:hypothetical protein
MICAFICIVMIFAFNKRQQKREVYTTSINNNCDNVDAGDTILCIFMVDQQIPDDISNTIYTLFCNSYCPSRVNVVLVSDAKHYMTIRDAMALYKRSCSMYNLPCFQLQIHTCTLYDCSSHKVRIQTALKQCYQQHKYILMCDPGYLMVRHWDNILTSELYNIHEYSVLTQPAAPWRSDYDSTSDTDNMIPLYYYIKKIQNDIPLLHVRRYHHVPLIPIRTSLISSNFMFMYGRQFVGLVKTFHLQPSLNIYTLSNYCHQQDLPIYNSSVQCIYKSKDWGGTDVNNVDVQEVLTLFRKFPHFPIYLGINFSDQTILPHGLLGMTYNNGKYNQNEILAKFGTQRRFEQVKNYVRYKNMSP